LHLILVQFYLLHLNPTAVLLTIVFISELAVFILYFVYLLRKYENTTKIKNKCYFLYALKWVSAIVFNIQPYTIPFLMYICTYTHTHAHLYKRANQKIQWISFGCFVLCRISRLCSNSCITSHFLSFTITLFHF